MTLWIWILLIVSIVFGVAYTKLGFQARDHLNEQASNSDSSVGWFFWWSFDKDKYTEEGRRLCTQGQVFAYVLLALYVAWYFVLLKK